MVARAAVADSRPPEDRGRRRTGQGAPVRHVPRPWGGGRACPWAAVSMSRPCRPACAQPERDNTHQMHVLEATTVEVGGPGRALRSGSLDASPPWGPGLRLAGSQRARSAVEALAPTPPFQGHIAHEKNPGLTAGVRSGRYWTKFELSQGPMNAGRMGFLSGFRWWWRGSGSGCERLAARRSARPLPAQVHGGWRTPIVQGGDLYWGPARAEGSRPRVPFRTASDERQLSENLCHDVSRPWTARGYTYSQTSSSPRSRCSSPNLPKRNWPLRSMSTYDF